MKGWKLTDKKTVLEEEVAVKETVSNASKVKVTKAMINLSDVLRYNGEMESEKVVLGSYGLGIISETDANLLGLERGKRAGTASLHRRGDRRLVAEGGRRYHPPGRCKPRQRAYGQSDQSIKYHFKRRVML